MLPADPLPLNHSWPLFDADIRMDLGRLCDPKELSFTPQAALPDRVGHWACDLRDNALRWDDRVYDMFGFPRGVGVARADSVRVYSEESRVAMERLRAHAIRYRRGFTLDTLLRVGAKTRAMRLICAPVCEDGKVTALKGIKIALTR